MPKAAGEEQSERRKLRVLIADDVEETRRSTRLMLSIVPNTKVIAIAHDGRQAVEMARQHHPDIALIDVNMPHMNGLEAIAAMREDQPELGCIIISAEQDRVTFQEAMAVGARGYITKPFTSEQLAQAVERVGQTVMNRQQKTAEITKMRRQRNRLLLELAIEYMRQERADERAQTLYEQLAAMPNCDPRILMALAVVYAKRQQWSKLKQLAARLEQANS